MFSIKDLEPEIAQIPNEKIREWTRLAISKYPDNFWTAPASSSGKYHPRDETLPGGTVIHTKRVFFVAKLLVNSESVFLEKQEKTVYWLGVDSEWKYEHIFESEILSAVLFHDICRGDGKCHPEMVKPYYTVKLGEDFVNQYPRIFEHVLRHMGIWSNKETPQNLMDRIVHYSDNIAAHAHLIMDAGYNKIE